MESIVPSRFTCKAQVDALIISITQNENDFWLGMVNVFLAMPSDGCPKHVRCMTISEANSSLKFGVIRYNDDSDKSNVNTADVTPELRAALEFSAALAGDGKYLFASNLLKGNRGKALPVTRQHIHRILKRNLALPRAATRDAGITGEFNLYIRTLAWFDGSKSSAGNVLEQLVSIHGGNLSEQFLKSVSKELTLLRSS